MSIKQVHIPVSELVVGMYVTRLDRPWCDTPFPIQGFFIRSSDDIRSLSGYCRSVVVDVQVSRVDVSVKHAVLGTRKLALGEEVSKQASETQENIKSEPLIIKNPVHYQVSASIKSECKKAEKLYSTVLNAVDKLFSESVVSENIEETELAAKSMVESVIRNPDALVWLARVNAHHSLSHTHAINASIWALVFGRYLGLEQKQLVDLAMGVLLSSVGKSQIDSDILSRADRLNKSEFEIFKGYVSKSVEILESAGSVNSYVINIVKCHRERHNGTGFPEGLMAQRIPLLARIAGLVDYFQDLLDPHDDRESLSPVDAVGQLYALRNVEFQADLIEKFIKAIGIYPTGTVVELTSDEVAIVISNNPERRLWPKIMIVLDAMKQPLKNAKVVDLLELNSNSDDLLQVCGSLPAGAFGVDPGKYLVTGANSRWSWQHLVG